MSGGSYQRTVLHAAVLFNRIEIIKLILAHQHIDVNARDKFGVCFKFLELLFTWSLVKILG